MKRFDEDKLNDLIDAFEARGYDQSPVALAIDSYVGLLNAGFSEPEAMELSSLICENFYRDKEVGQ
ncbi:MAG: hypothetical protein GX581_08705 [Syntrophomonadaceae bacterium]|jgi:hypothetical protein|nr:hypothetical protein [Syntrophomonadaceae bacterium]NLN84458.1 hypothetical protein [Bacillota bacterium]